MISIAKEVPLDNVSLFAVEHYEPWVRPIFVMAGLFAGGRLVIVLPDAGWGTADWWITLPGVLHRRTRRDRWTPAVNHLDWVFSRFEIAPLPF